MSPFEKLYGTAYDISSLKVFSCLCYTSTLTKGYITFDLSTKGYITFDLSTRATMVSRHVIFYENCFPYASLSAFQYFPTFLVHSYPTIYDHGKDFDFSSSSSHFTILDNSQSPNIFVDHSQLGSSNTSSDPSNSPIIIALRRSDMERTIPKKFQDFHTTFTSLVTGQSSSTRYPLVSVLSYKSVSYIP